MPIKKYSSLSREPLFNRRGVRSRSRSRSSTPTTTADTTTTSMTTTTTTTTTMIVDSEIFVEIP